MKSGLYWLLGHKDTEIRNILLNLYLTTGLFCLLNFPYTLEIINEVDHQNSSMLRNQAEFPSCTNRNFSPFFFSPHLLANSATKFINNIEIWWRIKPTISFSFPAPQSRIARIYEAGSLLHRFCSICFIFCNKITRMKLLPLLFVPLWVPSRGRLWYVLDAQKPLSTNTDLSKWLQPWRGIKAHGIK